MNLTVIETANILGMELNIYGDKEHPLFLAKDIAEKIEHTDVSMMCKNLELETEKLVQTMLVAGQNREVTMLTEDGVYEVLMTSRKPIAKEFRKGFKAFLKAWRKGEVNVVSAKEKLLIGLFSKDPLVVAESHKALIELETKPLLEKIEKQDVELDHKEDVIVGLVDGIDLATKRRRITQVIRHGKNVNYQERYNLLYREFEMKYNVDLERRMNSSKVKIMKPKIKNKMDLIDRSLNMIPQLYEIACLIFETDMEQIINRFERNI